MGKKFEKLIRELEKIPTDYTFAKAERLLVKLGYSKHNKGRTSGSRVLFMRSSDGRKIFLHKPHPDDQMVISATRELYKALKEYGDIE